MDASTSTYNKGWGHSSENFCPPTHEPRLKSIEDRVGEASIILTVAPQTPPQRPKRPAPLNISITLTQSRSGTKTNDLSEEDWCMVSLADVEKEELIHLSKKNESKISKIIQQTINQEKEQLKPRSLEVKSKIVLDEKVINIYYEKLKMQCEQLSRDNNLNSLSTTSEYQDVKDLKSFIKGKAARPDFLKELGFYCIMSAKRKEPSPILQNSDSDDIKKSIGAKKKSTDPQDIFVLELSKNVEFQNATANLVMEVNKNNDLYTLLIEFKKITKHVADYCTKKGIKLPEDSPLAIMQAILIAANINSNTIVDLCKVEEDNIMEKNLFMPSDLEQHLLSWTMAINALPNSIK